MRDMTDNDIIKALDSVGTAMGVALGHHSGQADIIADRFRELIDENNHQKAEIESLKHRKTELQIRNQELQHEKSEAIKEFAEKLKNCFAISGDYLDIINIIDNLVKEMMEVNEK